MFNLTATEMEAEPVDEFYTNLYISGQIENKRRLEEKNG